MPLVKENGSGSPVLVTSREPQGTSADAKKSVGDQALMDAIVLILVAWGVLFALLFSLRAHNI